MLLIRALAETITPRAGQLVWETTCLDRRWSFSRKSIKIMELYGRVAQLGEHLLCKHAFISPKSLNRRLLTVQNPLLVGLLIGLHKIKVLCPSSAKRIPCPLTVGRVSVHFGACQRSITSSIGANPFDRTMLHALRLAK